MTQAALKVIRSVFRVSSVIAPGWTGKQAFRLFCMPLGKAAVDASNPAVREAQRLFAQAEIENVSHPAGFVRVYRFSPEGAARGTVLVLHGLNGQALFMHGFIADLLARGFRVIAVDLPAHGGSSGQLFTFPRTIGALESVLRAEEPLAGIVAHSVGGAVAVIAASGMIRAFEAIVPGRLVLISAPRAVQPYSRAFLTMLGVSRRAHAAFEREVAMVTGRDLAEFSARDALAGLQIPTRVIHAPDDKEIPHSDALELASAGEHVELVALNGHGHRRILGAADAHRAAGEFIAAGSRKAAPVSAAA